MSILLRNSALDEFKRGDESTIVIRGVIDPASFGEIKADDYQREIVSNHKISALAKAIKTSRVPDVELGMRGDRARELPDGQYKLLDDVYVIDGLQRLTGGRHLLQTDPTAEPRIGATVHLNTTKEWERERFRILNQERTKIAPNVLLRNMCPDVPGLAMLKTLCGDSSFVLKDRVTWSQNMLRTEIITALTLCRIVAMLHRRFSGLSGHGIRDLATCMTRVLEKTGKISVRENTKYFFDIIDECWGVRRIVYVRSAAYMRSGFLVTLANLFARHEDFWKGPKLFVPRDLRSKIQKFAINDPEVVRLAGASGKAQSILYTLMVEHINSGKRTKHLTPTPGLVDEMSAAQSEPDFSNKAEAPAS